MHDEVPKEEATVKTVGALKQQHGDQHLAIGCQDQLKKQTKGNGESWKKLAAACRRMTCHAGTARHKGHSRKGPMVEQTQQKNWSRDHVARRTSKGQMLGKRRQKQPECNNGIRDQGAIQQLHLSEEEDDNRQRHQRMKQETGAMSGKHEDII
jgi:hypothetical protein